jgi:predicted NodU family carbamoyl transferase
VVSQAKKQHDILGINAYHGDSSGCLIRDGAIVAAAEKERFRRVKHWAGFPSQAIGYCLAEAGISRLGSSMLPSTAIRTPIS